MDQTKVCPLAFDLSISQISGPLTQFQTSLFDYDGLWKIIQTVNAASADNQIKAETLRDIYDVWFPILEKNIGEIPLSGETPPERKISDILDEILQIGREQLRRENVRLE